MAFWALALWQATLPVAPTDAWIAPKKNLQFSTAAPAGTTLEWSVEVEAAPGSDAGRISKEGLYTAPIDVPQDGAVIVRVKAYNAEGGLAAEGSTRAYITKDALGGWVLVKLGDVPAALKKELAKKKIVQAAGLREFDAALARLNAAGFYGAFTFLEGKEDRVGLDRWVLVVLSDYSHAEASREALAKTRGVDAAVGMELAAAYRGIDHPQAWEMTEVKEEVKAEGGAFTPSADASIRVDTTVTGKDVLIAIVDTGADVQHVDLKDRLHKTRGKNFADFRLKTNAWDWSTTLMSDHHEKGHGTCVASLAAGSTNTAGRSGVAPEASLMVCDMESVERKSNAWGAAAGIIYAAANGAKVIVCAWSVEKPDRALFDACKFAGDAGAIVVAAAGGYPAEYGRELKTVLAVGATDEKGAAAPYSKKGLIEARAPGGTVDDFPKILAAASAPGNDDKPSKGDTGMTWFGGVSAATGLAGGVAAQVASVNPKLTAEEIKKILVDTTRRGGLIDATAAVIRAKP